MRSMRRDPPPSLPPSPADQITWEGFHFFSPEGTGQPHNYFFIVVVVQSPARPFVLVFAYHRRITCAVQSCSAQRGRERWGITTTHAELCWLTRLRAHEMMQGRVKLITSSRVVHGRTLTDFTAPDVASRRAPGSPLAHRVYTPEVRRRDPLRHS